MVLSLSLSVLEEAPLLRSLSLRLLLRLASNSAFLMRRVGWRPSDSESAQPGQAWRGRAAPGTVGQTEESLAE